MGGPLRRAVLVNAARSALGWGLGVGAGVALGAYLTAVGGAGAPGVSSLETSDIAVLPLASAGVAFVFVIVAHLGASLVAGVLRARRSDEDHDDKERTEDDRIAR